MNAPMTHGAGTGERIAAQACLSRLAHEIEVLVGTSLRLQEAIHALPLAQSGPETRRILQSADTMTQSLQCLRAALDGLARAPQTQVNVDLQAALDGVFLEDVRHRLTTGSTACTGTGRVAPGEVDFF